MKDEQYETFRVYRRKRPGSYWFEVKLFPNRDAMYQYHEEASGDSVKGWAGMCCGLTVINADGKLSKCLGEILLCWEKCTINVIAHECTHAGFRIAQKIHEGAPFKGSERSVSEPEETVAESTGHLTSQVFEWYYKNASRLSKKWGDPEANF